MRKGVRKGAAPPLAAEAAATPKSTERSAAGPAPPSAGRRASGTRSAPLRSPRSGRGQRVRGDASPRRGRATSAPSLRQADGGKTIAAARSSVWCAAHLSRRPRIRAATSIDQHVERAVVMIGLEQAVKAQAIASSAAIRGWPEPGRASRLRSGPSAKGMIETRIRKNTAPSDAPRRSAARYAIRGRTGRGRKSCAGHRPRPALRATFSRKRGKRRTLSPLAGEGWGKDLVGETPRPLGTAPEPQLPRAREPEQSVVNGVTMPPSARDRPA